MPAAQLVAAVASTAHGQDRHPGPRAPPRVATAAPVTVGPAVDPPRERRAPAAPAGRSRRPGSGSARRVRLQTALVAAAPVSEVLATHEADAGQGDRGRQRAAQADRRRARTASSSGATTRPATSLSLPVRTPGYACFRTWSLRTRTTSASTDTGAASTRRAWATVGPPCARHGAQCRVRRPGRGARTVTTSRGGSLSVRQASRSISATRKASSRDWTRLRRGSTTDS